MPYGQPYGIDQSATVTILMQHFFGKFITGPYWNGLFQLSWGIMYFSIQDFVSHGIAPIHPTNPPTPQPIQITYGKKGQLTAFWQGRYHIANEWDWHYPFHLRYADYIARDRTNMIEFFALKEFFCALFTTWRFHSFSSFFFSAL